MDAASPSPHLDRPDRVDALIDYLTPVVIEVIDRLEGEEFTTVEFLEILLSVPEGCAAYRDALVQWGEGERYAKMVVHGQVLPAAMRRSPRIEWIGFAHDEADTYAVPARWRLIPRGIDPENASGA